MGGQRHAPAALPPEKTRYRLGEYKGRCGRLRKISPHRDSTPGPSRPQRVATPTELSRSINPASVVTPYLDETTIMRYANPSSLVAQATKFLMMAPHTSSTITAVYSLHTKICISSHAPSRQRRKTARVRGHCRTRGPQYRTWFMSTFLRHEIGGDTSSCNTPLLYYCHV